MKLETLCLHGGQVPEPTTFARAVAVYRTSGITPDPVRLSVGIDDILADLDQALQKAAA